MLGALAFALAYGGLGWLSFRVVMPDLAVPAFWLANGLGIGVLTRLPLARWPVFLVALVLADAYTSASQGMEGLSQLAWILSDILVCVIAAGLLRRYASPYTTLSRMRELLVFAISVGVVAPLVGSIFGIWGPTPSRAVSPFQAMALWWLTESLGNVAVSSLVLTWAVPGKPPNTLGRSVETLLVSVAMAGFVGWTFQLQSLLVRDLFLVFTTFPVVSLVALRYGGRGASTVAAAAGAVTVWQTVSGEGAFAGVGFFTDQLLAVQAFFALAALSGLLLAAIAEERRVLHAQAERHARRLEESLALLDTTLDNAPIGLAFLDRNLRYLRVNPTLARMHGVPRDEHLKRHPLDICPGIYLAVERDLKKALRGEPTVSREMEVELRGGAVAHWLYSFYPVEVQGTSIGVGVVVVDITALREERRALALSEARFRSLAVATAEIVWSADEKGELLDSASWQEYTGQSREEQLGFGWLQAVHPEDRKWLRDAWRRAMKRGTTFSLEYRILRRDGVYRHHETRAAPLMDEETGKIREWVGMSFDVTRRKEAEEERIRLLRRTEKALRARDEFLSVASHELKTPLTPLSTRLQILRRKLEAGEEIDASIVEKAQTSLNRLTALINDLLDASRIQAGRFQQRVEPVAFSTLVRKYMASTGASPRHRFVTRVPDGEIWVRGDADRLEQVLANLVDNAVKYSPEGGKVEVQVDRWDGDVILEVSDEGVGIPEDKQRMLFTRFFRAHSSQGFGGLGLGLYIVRDIVEKHGGRVWVRSKAGKGSRFYVALPTIQPPSASPPPHGPHSIAEPMASSRDFARSTSQEGR